MKSKTPFIGKWRDGVYILDGSVCGRVEQTSIAFFAYGMMTDWDDTPLGSFHGQREAREAVIQWAIEND